MIRPKPLKPGDMVGLIAPSGPVIQDRIPAAIASVEAMGFKVKLGESCYAAHGYLAGSDVLRARDMNDMFADESVRGIFAMRGGYGAQRILPMLDYEIIRRNPKPFAGYSDITAFHVAINQRCCFATYHSPMAATQFYEGVDDYTMDSFYRAMTDDSLVGVAIQNPIGQEMLALVPGRAEGILTGGNLSLMATSLGTPFEMDTKDKIIFIEDVEEEPYVIDRWLTQMRNAGKFRDCAGIVLGVFSRCYASEPTRSLTLYQIFTEVLVPEDKPMVMGLACGHCMPTMTLCMGAMVHMDATRKEIVYSGH